MSSSQPGRLDRRSVILAGTALIGTVALPGTGTTSTGQGLAPGGEFLAATQKFLATLDPAKRKTASFPWDGREWRGWNYFGGGGYIKPGPAARADERRRRRPPPGTCSPRCSRRPASRRPATS